MRCSNLKRRCGLFDMPDGSIWFSQSEPPADQPAGVDKEAFSMSTLPQKCFGMVLVAVGSSFSGVGRHPVSFWLGTNRVQMQGRSGLRLIRFRSAFVVPLSSKRNS
jgi:hypothetical protein